MDSSNDSLIKSPDSPLCASYNPSLPLDLIKDEEIEKMKGDAIGNFNLFKKNCLTTVLIAKNLLFR